MSLFRLSYKWVSVSRWIFFCGVTLSLVFDSPSFGMLGADGVAFAGGAGAELVGEQEGIEYRPTQQIFDLISPARCEVSVTGELFSCRRPELRFEEALERLPPLPYETKVVIRTSSSCRGRIAPDVGSLHARLGRFTEQADDFLRDEVFSFSQSQIFIFNQPQSYPFKNLVIASRAPEIFSGARFPEGCEVSVEVEFNRIALKSKPEAEAYVAGLREQVGLMRHLNSSLLLLHESRTQRRTSKSLLTRLQGVFIREKTKMDRIRRQWETLQGVSRAVEESVRKHHALSTDPALQALTGSMAAFSRVLNQVTRAQELGPETLRDLVTDARARDAEFLEAQLDQFLEPERLREMQLKLDHLELQLATTLRTLESYFQVCEYPRCCEDFGDLFFAELCGPHGVIDEIRHGIRQIAPRADEALPRE